MLVAMVATGCYWMQDFFTKIFCGFYGRKWAEFQNRLLFVLGAITTRW